MPKAAVFPIMMLAFFFTLTSSRGVWHYGRIRILCCIAAHLALVVGLLTLPDSEQFSWLYLVTSVGVAWWSRYGWLHYK